MKLRLPRIPAVWARGLTIVLKGFLLAVLITITGIVVLTFIETKNLAVQNQSIALENQKHIDCIADLFARYTRDNKPITIIDLSKCKATQKDVLEILNHGSRVNAPTPTKLPEQDNQSQNNNTKQATSQSQNTNPSAPVQKPAVKVLGVPVCVPLTGVCLRR